MTRDEALSRIKEPKPFEADIIEEVKKRLNLKEGEFEALMDAPGKTYRDYLTYKETFEKMRWFFLMMAKLDLVPASFYMKYTKKYVDP